MKVYIVIVTYNGMAWLAKCLASIPKEYAVVVVDNNSSDKSVQFIEQNYPQVQLFKEAKNLGFGQANNKGISYALQQGADYVFLLNQDAYLESDTIEKLISVYSDFPDYGVLSPIHTNRAKNRLDRNFSTYLDYKNNDSFYSDFVLGRPISKVYNVPFVNAAGWLIPKKTLLTVGGFDPIFFHYGEDDNYCQRVTYHNFKIGIVPDAYMIHDRSERKIVELKHGSERYFKQLEKHLKIKYCNINFNIMEKYLFVVQEEKKRHRKELLKLNYKKSQYHKAKFKLMYGLISEMQLSVLNNREAKPSYLEI